MAKKKQEQEQDETRAVAERPATPPAAPATYHTELQALNAQLRDMRESGYQVLGIAAYMPAIPEGMGIALNVIRVDTTPPDKYGRGGGGDVYKPDWRDNGLAFTKTLLDRIGAAYGVTWLPHESRRVDDGREPLYCRYRAVGRVHDFDGGFRQAFDEKEIDLRPGSPLVRGYRRQAEAAVKRESEGKSLKPEAFAKLVDAKVQARVDQVAEHIVALAISKARNRVVRHLLGIKSKYRPEDLQKPIVVPKLVGAPETIKDDELRRQLTAERLRALMGITGALYGDSTPTRIETPGLIDVTPGAEAPAETTPPPPVKEDAPLDPDDAEEVGGEPEAEPEDDDQAGGQQGGGNDPW